MYHSEAFRPVLIFLLGWNSDLRSVLLVPCPDQMSTSSTHVPKIARCQTCHLPPAGAMDIKNGAAAFIQNSTYVDNTGARGGAIVVEGNSGSIIQVWSLAGCSAACMARHGSTYSRACNFACHTTAASLFNQRKFNTAEKACVCAMNTCC